MKLSIVVPSLNQGRYLSETLESLCGQRNLLPGELEVVVRDGGSTDETVSILKRWDVHLASWTSQPDNGQTDALIQGFRQCTGDILGWLCSDDLIEPWTVREVLDTFQDKPNVDFLYGDASWITSSGEFLRLKKEIAFNWFIWLHDHNYIPQPAAFWRRSLYDRVGGLDASFNLAMDGDLFARFAQQTYPLHVPRQWARLRSYPEQKNKRLRHESDREDRIIRERMGVSYGSGWATRARFGVAKAWRIAWKLKAGAYAR